MYKNLPNTRQKALKEKSTHYFTNIPCKNEHLCKRNTKTTRCLDCEKIVSRKYYYNNLKQTKEAARKSYLKHRNKNIARSKKWHENNREKSNKLKKKWKEQNKEKYLKSESERNKKKRQNPLFRLNKNMSKAIWSWLQGSKNFQHWEEFIPYTKEKLIKHLESLFAPWMTWDNYGAYDKNKKTWHVDHIKPLSLCASFEEAWSLNNLQPLGASENCSKGNKYKSNNE